MAIQLGQPNNSGAISGSATNTGGINLNSPIPSPVTPTIPIVNSPNPISGKSALNTTGGLQTGGAGAISVPTSVVSTAPAVNQVNQAKQVVDTSTANTNQLYNTSNGFVTPYGLSQGAKPVQAGDPAMQKTGTTTTPTPPPPTPAPTPEETIVHDGQSQYYNLATGQQEWVQTPTNGGTPSGYSTTNPISGTAINSFTSSDGFNYKQLPNDSSGNPVYVKYNPTTNTLQTINAGTYQAQQQIATDTTALNNLKNNGILTPTQQSQIDAITTSYTKLISDQTTANANATGGQTIAQNMYGMGNTLAGQGEIQKTVQDGITKITNLTNEMNSAIAKMKAGFLVDDDNAVKEGWATYTESQKETQKQLDLVQSNLQKTADRDYANLQNYIFKSSNLHPDAGIDGTEQSIAEINAKILKSATFKEKQTIVDTTPVDGNAPNPDTANVPSALTGKTPDALWKDANDYNLSGKTVQSYLGGLSSAAQGSAYKTAIANKSAEILKNAGISSVSTLQQEYKANSLALNQLTKYMNDVDLNVKKAEDGVDQVVSTFNKSGINTYDSTWLNKTLNSLSKNLTDSGDIRAYQAGVFEVSNDYSQVFTRGGQRNQAADERANQILSGDITLGDFIKVTDSLKSQGKLVVKDSIDQMKKVSNGGVNEVVKYLNYINNAPTSTATPSTTGSTTGSSTGGVDSGWAGFPGQ